jgi:hypothetical protein
VLLKLTSLQLTKWTRYNAIHGFKHRQINCSNYERNSSPTKVTDMLGAPILFMVSTTQPVLQAYSMAIKLRMTESASEWLKIMKPYGGHI